MTRLLLAILSCCVVLLTPLHSQAASVDVNISWDPDPELIASFRLYHTIGTNSTQWTLVATVPSTVTSIVQTNLSLGLHRWYLTAVNDQGIESLPSNEVSYRVWQPQPPNLHPVELKIAWSGAGDIPTTASIEQSMSLDGLWERLFSWELGIQPNAFYRVLLQ